MTHPLIAQQTYLGMALNETIDQMGLQREREKLMSCLIKAIDKNLPYITLDSLRSKITLNVEQLQSIEIPQSKDTNRYQYFRGILHNVECKSQNQYNFLLNGQKRFAIIELIGDNSSKPITQKSQKVIANTVKKRSKTLQPTKGKKHQKIN